jgi:hypothetical protein
MQPFASDETSSIAKGKSIEHSYCLRTLAFSKLVWW